MTCPHPCPCPLHEAARERERKRKKRDRRAYHKAYRKRAKRPTSTGLPRDDETSRWV